MVELFGGRPHLVTLPAGVVRPCLAVARVVARTSSTLSATVRRAELLAFGQQQRAEALEATGFRPPLGAVGYRTLAALVRSDMGAPQ
jgi:hypothetical protein